MMMMQHTNDKRLALQEKALRQLEEWLEVEMTVLDEQLMLNRITRKQYNDSVKRLQRDYDEDYNDIFAG